ncbi:MAG: GTP 3',8-cyclase MoaA [Actinobacteria bacterium]|nr:GTP 3',8-cyclase MoaA [Actinomycetota bacterium]
MNQLLDGYGRRHKDLRLSVTDRCSLRCTYCMPAQGLDWLPKDEQLTRSELVRLVRLCTELGIESVRITGGEPLLRPDIADIVADIRALQRSPKISLTTNGLRLPQLAAALAGAGLDRVNISLDTLKPDVFIELTRRDKFAETLAGIAAAQQAGLQPVKINTVLMRGVNEQEAPELLTWALRHGLLLRFIEQMPLDPQHGWDADEFVTQGEILDLLRSAGFRLTPRPRTDSAPATEWDVRRSPAGLGRIGAGPKRVGIVASVSAPFCSSCDRIRVTSDGQFRTCLFSQRETDLRTPLRAGADDEELRNVLARAILGKGPGHGINHPDFTQPDRPMSAIGG